MITYTIRPESGEYVVRFREDGVRRPSWDYFASDKADAVSTAEATVIRANSGATLQSE